MPILPTVDYSPVNQAIAGLGAAKQAGYQTQLASLSDKYRSLQKSEETRQAVFGTIDGVLGVATQVYGIMEQSKMEVGKQALIQQSAANQKYIEESRLNGKIHMGQDATGQAIIEVDDEVTQYFENQVKELDDSPTFKGFDRVKGQLKTSLIQTQTGSLEQARTALFQKAQSDGTVAHEEMLSNRMDAAVRAKDYGIFASSVLSSGITTPAGKETELMRGADLFAVRVKADEIRGLVSEGGLSEGMSAADTYAGNEQDRDYLKAVAIKADKEAESAALESSAGKYEATKKAAEESGKPFMPDATIDEIVNTYPESRQAVVESQLRKAQTYSNLRSGTEQFNADRDNPSLSYLEKQYNTIQSDPIYEGDELTRSTVMSWYEGLIGNQQARIASEASGASKDADDNALRLIESTQNLFESGNISGHEAIQIIEDKKNRGEITGPQAATARKAITGFKFPDSKAYLDGSQNFAMKALGMKKKYADLGTEEQRRVNALSTSYEAYISDKLFEQGADADLDKVSEDALSAITSKAFDEVRQGSSLFKSREDITETAMSKTIEAFDTPAGSALTFQDRHGNIKYLSENPEQTANTIETVAQYGTEQLEARGIKVAKWKLESEGKYDVGSMPVFIGADGLQYRMKRAGDKVEYYSRGSESAEWKKLPEPSKPTVAPISALPSARPGATTPAPVSKVTPITDEAYAAAQAREKARQEAIRKAAEEAAKKEAERKGRR